MNLPSDVLIGLDAGTARVTAAAFTPNGRELGRASAGVAVHHVADGGVEQELGDAWLAAATALRGLTGRVPDLAARTAALAITGPGGGTWLIDEDGDPVARAWLPADRRAVPLVAQWRRAVLGRQLRAISGSAPEPALPSMQLAWMAARCPALLDHAATAFQGKDWLYFCCTHERATDSGSAAAAFGDFRTGTHDARMLERLRLEEMARLLPAVVDGMRDHGELTAAAAAATGLIAGTPVILGPVDVVAIALAAGLAAEAGPGCTILRDGGIHIRADRQPPDIGQGTDGVGAVVPYAGTWFKLARGPSAVTAPWLVELAAQLLADAGLIGNSRDELVAVLESKAAAAVPGALLFDPGTTEADRRLAGRPAGFLGLSGATTFYDLLRSIHEAHGLAARACYDALGGKPVEVRVTGEGAASALARQVLAACVDAPLRVIQRETPAAAGAALIAAVARGHYPTLDEASRDWVGPWLAALEPVDQDLQAVYTRRGAAAPVAPCGGRAALAGI